MDVAPNETLLCMDLASNETLLSMDLAPNETVLSMNFALVLSQLQVSDGLQRNRSHEKPPQPVARAPQAKVSQPRR